MKKDIYIFIGQSGAGKGTQAALLDQKLKVINPNTEILHLETGKKFRSLIQESSFTAQRVRALIAAGTLPPPFLGIHMWSGELVDRYAEHQSVIIDGTPRVAAEVPILLSACEFYTWRPHVINVRVSDEWAYEHTIARGREDDKDAEDVRRRIAWYHESVAPAIELLRASDILTFHDIDGEQTIEAVHANICQVLGL